MELFPARLVSAPENFDEYIPPNFLKNKIPGPPEMIYLTSAPRAGRLFGTPPLLSAPAALLLPAID